MKTRNAKYNKHGTIDCEIDHPTYGWIPFTASPDDVEESGRTIHAELLAAGNIAAYVRTQASIDAELSTVKQEQKELLRLRFVDSMLSVEFAAIDAAGDKVSVKAVKPK